MLNKHTDKSITDISYACGFSTTSYFIQKFKERYGQTPKQFLKQIKSKRFLLKNYNYIDTI